MPERRVTKDGTTIKIATTKGKKAPKVLVTVMPDEVVGGFVTFLREHAIVGLAVGLVIGTQVKALVDQLVNSFINPLFTLFFGGKKLQERTFTVNLFDNSANFGWGAFAYIMIDFIFVLAAIYFLIKFFKLDKLDKKKES